MPQLDVETRLANLEAKEEIREFIASYTAVVDRIDALDDLLALFTEDAVMRNPAGVHDGKAAITEYFTKFFSSGATNFSRHHATNQVITILEPGIARHESYFMAFLGREGDSKIAFGRYKDIVVKQDGVWRFREKGNDIVAMTSLKDGWAAGFLPGGLPVKAA